MNPKSSLVVPRQGFLKTAAEFSECIGLLLCSCNSPIRGKLAVQLRGLIFLLLPKPSPPNAGCRYFKKILFFK